ncbi:MAG: DUF3192 domain-containing protein [Candidatus Omnitrophica bacterium]|nr:DUF3192 domain-containing protein [Candidatus Omnitrophota bacterium]
MKNFILILLCLVICGCASVSKTISPNRANLLKLSIGMDKSQALEVMGTKPFHVMGGTTKFHTYGSSIEIDNPYRSEILVGKDDKKFEVIYYVTDVKVDDTAITDDELTPLVFDNGELVGWGWSFLQDRVQKYEIRVR